MIKYIKHVFIIFVLLVSLPLFGHTVSDTSDNTIIFQATLPNYEGGSYKMDIGIYAPDQISSPLWVNTFKKVDISNTGSFTQELGKLKSIPPETFINENVRIGFTFYNGGELDPETTTLLPISATPYSFHSEISEVSKRLTDENVIKFDTINTRVGIGVLTPNYTLDVSGNVQAVKFIGDGSGLKNVNANTDQLVWKLDPSDKSISYKNGNIGIGTDTPTARLEVSGNVIINGDLIVKGLIDANQLKGDGANITNLSASQISNGIMPSDRIQGAYTGITALGTISTGIWNATSISDTYVSDELTLNGATIKGSNTISGNIILTGPTNIAGNYPLAIESPNWKLTDDGHLHIKSVVLKNQLRITKNNLEILSNNGLHIHPTGNDGLFIKSNGYIGVNTTTPRALLDINGGIRVSASATEIEGTIRYQDGYFEGFGKQLNQSSPAWNRLDYTSDLDSHALHAENNLIKNLIYIRSDGNIGIGGVPSNNITDNLVISGNVVMTASDTASPLTKSGTGTRMMWIPGKAAFRAGHASGSEWDDVNIGENSIVLGDSGLADTNDTVIIGGKDNKNQSMGSVIVGGYTNEIANSEFSVIVGGGQNKILSFGFYNTILGGHLNTISDAVSNASIIGGSNNTVKGNSSIAIGSDITIDHANAFIFSDGEAPRSTTEPNQFIIYAKNGVGINTPPSQNIALTVKGVVYADFFQGDGSQLLGVNASLLNDNTATTNSAPNSIYISNAQGFLPTNSIDSNSILNGSITSQDIKEGAISSKNIAPNSISNLNIAPNTIDSSKITPDSITSHKIQAYAISSKNIKAGGISSENIAANTIQTHHIVNGAITNIKIALNSIDSDNIVDGTITSQDIKAGAIASQNIAENAIQSHHILDHSITSKNIQSYAIQTHHLTDFLILPEHISSNAILSRHITSNAILTRHISDNAILSQHISSNVIIDSLIEDHTIPSDKIALNSISSEHISPNAILSEHISSNAILSRHISLNAIQSAHISANAILSSHIQDGTITSADIALNTITSKNILDGSISGDDIILGTFPSSLLAPNTITSKNIKPGSITSRNIGANAISSRNIQDNAIEAHHIQNNIISSNMIALGAIKSEHIATNAIQAHHITKNAITSENISAGTLSWEHIVSPSALPLTFIQDASITGAKIAPNTITSKNIQNNSIFVENIADGAISSDKITGTFGPDQGGIGDMLKQGGFLDGGVVYTKMIASSPNLSTTANLVWKNNQLLVGSPTPHVDYSLIVSGNMNIQGGLLFNNDEGFSYASTVEWGVNDNSKGFIFLGNVSNIGTATAPTGRLKASKLYVHDKVGIGLGVLDPLNSLDILDNMSIGYASELAPANGLIVKGDVGIGTSTVASGYQLHVSGNIYAHGIEAKDLGGSSVAGIHTFGGQTGIIASGNTEGIIVNAKHTGIEVTASSNGMIVTLNDPINNSIGVQSNIKESGTITVEGSLAKKFSPPSSSSNNFYTSIYGMVTDPNEYAGYFNGPVYISGNVGIGIDDDTKPEHALHVKGDIYVDGLIYTTENVVLVGSSPTNIDWSVGNKVSTTCDGTNNYTLQNLDEGYYFLTLRIKNEGAGACTISINAINAPNLKWAMDTPPTPIETNKIAIYSFYASSDGTTTAYYGLPPMIFGN
jgi:hypothetical protein